MPPSSEAKREKHHPIDVHVGRRMRARRVEQGLSQTSLAEALGVTFQQVQKYERGANRVVASRLFDLARALDVPVEYFFPDTPPPIAPHVAPDAPPDAAQSGSPDAATGLPSHRETHDLIRAYYAIVDPGLRKKLIELVRSVSRSQS